MEIDHSHLNKEQRLAVMDTDGPLLVLAGAGSGKTTVLTHRIAQIISQGTPPWAVLAITFTNKAANEMKVRLEKLLGADGREVWASTFHSMCVRILRRDIEALGYGRGFTIYDTDDQKRLMKAVLKELGLDDKRFAPGALLSVISKAKDAMRGPESFAASTGGDYFLEQAARCYTLYARRLREANALDFDDLILLTVRLFKEKKEVLEYYQRRFSFILVDEYQDTNMLQYQLVSMLAQKHRNLCVVGDDDQSIYRFRGAVIENILRFEEQYPDTRVIRLEQNYRSTEKILETANAVITHNRERKGKTLWTGKSGGDEVTFFQGYSDNDEARFVADSVMEGIRVGRVFSDFCVLYRMNALSARIENALRISGIPYRVVGGMRFFDRAEVRDMLAYMQVLRNPADDLRLGRIFNVPARDFGQKTQDVCAALAARDRVPMFQILRDAARYPELGRKAEKLKDFAQTLDTLARSLEQMRLTEFYDLLLARTGYKNMLEQSNDIEAQGRLENVMELKNHLAYYEESEPDPSLAGFLDEVALLADIDRLDDEAGAVTLMTIHSAKGLEFPAVFLVGAEENLLPAYRSLADPADIEEERRLCYVAVTRAREKLYITCAKERMQYGQTGSNPISRFVKEMKLVPEAPPAPAPRTVIKKDPPPRAAFSVGAGIQKTGKPSGELMKLDKGEIVIHKAFGRGMVITVAPMGGDALVEIAFDTVGTKRLMLKSAQAFMRKE
ncbi:MAG: UvrD-helicase domain-containing protein [Oscillospiraceae bacterium]|nr:UvrD-helicase domain-containing protein [Oscillospiraceae bacterium]